MKNTSNIRPVALDRSFVRIFAAALACVSAHAATFTWNGGASDDLFGSGANWGGSAPTPDATTDLIFDGSVRLTPNNNYTAFDNFHSITFAATASVFNVGGSAIDIFGKVENYSTVTQTISLAALAINGGQPGTGEFNPVNGDLVINSADVFTNGNNIRVFGVNNKTVTFGAGTVISQGGGLVVEQASNVVLLGASTYTGGTTVNAGSLTVGNGGTTGSIAGTSAVSIAAGAAMTWNNSNDTAGRTLANSISGAGTLTLQGQNATAALQTSLYTLSGNNTGFTGTLNINRSMVWNTTSQSQVGGAAIVVQDRGTMAFNGGTYSNSITVQNGAGWHHNAGGDVVLGAIRLEGSNTLSGNITLNNTTGIVLGDNTGANSTIAGWSAGTHALNGVISGPGDLAMSRFTSFNGGTPQAVNITLGGAQSNAFTGKTVVDGQGGAASLILAKTGGAVAIAANTVVQFGSGTVGQSNLRMGGNNQFGSGVVMNFVNAAGNWGRFDLLDTNQTVAGLNAGNATTLGGAVIQNGGINLNTTTGTSTLTLDGSGIYLYNGYIRNVDTGGTGKIALLKAGNGTQTLVGPQITYTGATTVNGGRLTFQDTTAVGSAITVNAGGTLSAVRTALGGAGRAQILANAVTLAGGILSIDNAGSGLAGGWTTFGVANGLTGTGTININSGVLSRDNTVANAINTSATVNVAAGAFFGAGRGGNSTIGGLNGAGVVSTLWGGTNAGSITIGNGDGSGSFSGTLDGNGTNATDLTQQGGVLSVIKVGAGTQTLSGANTYSGTTTVNGGSLVIQNLGGVSNNANLPGGKAFSTSKLDVASGATILVELGTTSLASTPGGLTLNGAGTIRKNGTGTWWLGNSGGGTAISMAAGGLIDIQAGVFKNDYANANWSANNGNLNIATGASVDMRNNAVRVGALTGGGLLDNAFSSAQTLTVGAGNATGVFTGNVRQTGGGALSVTKIGAGSQTLSGSATAFSGTTTVSQGTLVLDGTNLVTASPWSIAAGANLTINYANTAVDTWVTSGAITGTGTLTKTGPGWFLFQGSAPANFQGSIVINGGRLGNGFNTTVWTNSKADVFVGAGAELDMRVDDMIIDELTGTGTVVNTYAIGTGSDTLTVGSNNGSSQFDGVIRGIGGVGAINTSIDIGKTNLAKIGTGTFTLTGANVYGGTTTVNNGTLRLSGGNDRLPVGTALAVNGGATVGGTFDLNGQNQAVSQLNGAAGAISSIVTGGGVLTVNGAVNSTFAGNITGATALTKAGNGVLTLSGANTYSGPTLISLGGLRHGSAAAFSPNSNLQLNGGVIEAGFSSLALNTGTGGGSVQWLTHGGFAAAGAARDITLNGGADLTWSVNNFIGDGLKLLFGSAAGDNTASLTNNINLGGANRTVEIVAGPAAIEGALAGNVSNGILTVRGTGGSLALTGQSTADVVVDNSNAAGTNIMNLVLNRAGGNAIAAGLQIGATDNNQFATVRLGATTQIADTTVVKFGAVAGSWSYLNLNGFNETVAGLRSLPGKDGGVVQLVEADASPATNSTLTLNVASGTESYIGHIRDRGNGPSNDPGGNGRLGFVKEGSGTQELLTWNTQVWTGPTAVNNGTLRIGLSAANGGGGTLSSATTIAAGATLDVTNAANRNWWAHNGGISGAGSVIKSGDSIVNLTGASVNYTGATTVNSGILRLTDTTAFASNVTVNAGAWLEENRTTGSGNLAISMTGAGGYVKNGAGETILTSPVTLPQVAVRAGVLTAGADNVLTTATTLSQGGSSSHTFKLNGTAQTVGGLGAQYDFANRIIGGSPVPASLTVNIGAGQQTFYGGKIGDVGADENNLGITKAGPGTLVLSGTASHTGGTVIAGGTLQLGASTTMPVNLANLGIWLDGADPAATGTAPADGAPISIWKNKGTLGATGDFSAVAGQEPSYGAGGAGLMNGNPTVRFVADSVSGFANQTNFDRLTNNINLANGPSTVIVAGRYAGASADERKRMVSGLGNNYLLGWWNNGENAAYYQNGFAPGISAGTTNGHVYTSVMRGDGIGETYGNGLGRMGVLGNAVGPIGLALGGGNSTNVQEYSTGDIGEVIITPVAMSDADRGAIEAYLVRKWTGFMPTNPLPTSGTLSLSTSGATLNVNGVTQTTGSISGVAGTGIALGGGSLAAGNDNGNAQFDGIISGSGNLAKVGTGTWTLGSVNTYSAVTRVQNGTLELTGGADRLPTSTTVELGTTTTGGTLKLNGNNQTVAALSSGTNSGAANSRVINGSQTLATLTVNLASGSSSYSGKLGGSTADENNLGFIKQGAGTLVLGQSNTYTGSTVISGGTVQLGGARALPTSAAIWLDATDGGTINTSGGGVTSVTNKGTLGATGNFTAPAGNEPSLAFEASMGGNQVFRFDALAGPGPDQLGNALNFANNVTVAYIGRLAGTANQRLLSATSNWLLGPWGGSGETAFFENGFLYNGGVGSTDTLPRFHVGTIAANGAAAYYSNGTLLGIGTGNGPNGLRLGGGFQNSATEFASGDIGELFVFNGVLTDTQRTQLDSYIARKWYGLGNTNVLPTTTAVTLSGGSTLDVNGTDQTVASITGDAATSIVNSGLITVGDATSTEFAGAISGAGFLTKVGAGTLTLSGVSTSTGTTYVQGGTLSVTGSLSGSLIEVQSGGTLGGNGTIGADVFVFNGGKLSPGTSPGTLTVTGTTLDFGDAVFPANTQSLVFELGTISDRVNLTTGQFGIGIGTLEFDDFAFTVRSGFGPGTYTLFDSTQDVFGNLGASLSGTIDGYTATLSLGDTDNDVILTVVPEPGSAALLLGGLAMLAGRRKRR